MTVVLAGDFASEGHLKFEWKATRGPTRRARRVVWDAIGSASKHNNGLYYTQFKLHVFMFTFYSDVTSHHRINFLIVMRGTANVACIYRL